MSNRAPKAPPDWLDEYLARPFVAERKNGDLSVRCPEFLFSPVFGERPPTADEIAAANLDDDPAVACDLSVVAQLDAMRCQIGVAQALQGFFRDDPNVTGTELHENPPFAFRVMDHLQFVLGPLAASEGQAVVDSLSSRTRRLARTFGSPLFGKTLDQDAKLRIEGWRGFDTEAGLAIHDLRGLIVRHWPAEAGQSAKLRTGRPRKVKSLVNLCKEIVVHTSTSMRHKEIELEALQQGRRIGNIRATMSTVMKRFGDEIERLDDEEGDVVFQPKAPR